MFHEENIKTGVDAKLLVYEENASVISDKKINLQNIIKKNFFKNNWENNSNCILINKSISSYDAGANSGSLPPIHT